MPGFEPDRRGFVKSLAGVALGGWSAAGSPSAAWAQAVKWSSGTERPLTPVPAGATDCHHHVYDSRFPSAPGAVLLPPDASVADYRTLQHRLGTTRNVVVQPSTYGTDNRLLLQALSEFGPTARGVAVVDTNVSDADLRAMDAAGVRGIRFNLIQAGATTAEMIEPLARRVNDLGWHVQLHMTGDQIVAAKDILSRVPCALVFDHLARIPQPAGARHPAFAFVRGLLDRGRAWVKLSGAYIDTEVGPPTYADTSRLAVAFAMANPERMVWATDWPHPTAKTKPDDALLLDLFASWVPDAAVRDRMLVENPAALYRFD